VIHRFASDSAVTADESRVGTFHSRVDEGWSIGAQPNGGYLAATMLRAILAAGPEGQGPRLLTTHFLRPPAWGPAGIETRVERAGGRVSTVSARMLQGEEVCAVALAALGSSRESVEIDEHAAMPYAAEPWADAPVSDRAPAISHRYEFQLRDDPRESGRPVLGGRIRFRDGGAFDAPAVLAAADAWIPVLGVHAPGRLAVPTIALSVTFLRTVDPGTAPTELACRFRTSVAAEGYAEEDGEVWGPDGALLAVSRQISAVLPSS
jgi:acyl-coenzyme A thioesterase PaaI-like protein